MPDHTPHTPEQDEPRGPIDAPKPRSLKINKSPVSPVAPAAKPDGQNKKTKPAPAKASTDEKHPTTRPKESSGRAPYLMTASVGLMMILSALFMILPLKPIIQAALDADNIVTIVNYPTILIGLFDLILGILLLLSMTSVFPLARGRAMLTLGFGVYVGWALADPLLMGLAAAAGIGIFLTTISQSMGTRLLAFVLGIGGNGYLAYLAFNGRFDGFFDTIVFNLVAS